MDHAKLEQVWRELKMPPGYAGPLRACCLFSDQSSA